MATGSIIRIPEDSTTPTSTTTLADGGYDYELLGSDTDSRYECPICLLYLRDPVLTTCGHRFCERCIAKWVIKEGGTCPVDGVILEYENIFPDNFTRREILQCRAKCPHAKEGCTVILSLSELEKHIQTIHVQSGDAKGSSRSISSISSSLVECYYKEVGCLSVFPQENLQRHLDVDMHHHLQLLTAAYRRLKVSRPNDFFFRQDSRDSTRWLLGDEAGVDSDDYQFRRQRSWDSVRFARQTYSRPRVVERLAESEESLSKGKGSSDYQVPEKVANLHKSEESQASVNGVPSNQMMTAELFERLVRLEQSDREKQIKLERLEAQLSSALKLSSALTRAMDELTARYCRGIYVWKIPNFTKLCEDMRKTPSLVLTSPGFYTGVFEYKLCLRFNLKTPVKLDGAMGGTPLEFPPLDRDDDTFVSLNIHFMRGEFDENLRWPFQGVISLQILHVDLGESLIETMRSKMDAIAFARPIEPKNKTGFGYSEFCTMSRLFSGGFVRNDILSCRITVRTTTLDLSNQSIHRIQN